MRSTPKRLQDLWDLGVRSPKELTKRSGLYRTTIAPYLKKLRQGLPLQKKKIPGRPPIMKPNDRRRLIALARNRDSMTSRDLKTEMIKRGSPKVCSSSIRRTLNKSGYVSRKPRFTALLTDQRKAKRLAWRQRNTKTRWEKWVLSDESRFQLFSNHVGGWSKTPPKLGVRSLISV